MGFRPGRIIRAEPYPLYRPCPCPCASLQLAGVWDAGGAVSAYSAAAHFATGLADEDWNASWLQLGSPPKKRSFYWYARAQRSLTAGKTPVRALAYFCIQHEYDLYVNGLRLGRGQSFDYPGEQRYQGWDITRLAPPSPWRWRAVGSVKGRAAPRVLGTHPNEVFPRVFAEPGHVGGETMRPVSVTRLKSGFTARISGR